MGANDRLREPVFGSEMNYGLPRRLPARDRDVCLKQNRTKQSEVDMAPKWTVVLLCCWQQQQTTTTICSSSAISCCCCCSRRCCCCCCCRCRCRCRCCWQCPQSHFIILISCFSTDEPHADQRSGFNDALSWSMAIDDASWQQDHEPRSGNHWRRRAPSGESGDQNIILATTISS